MSDNIIFMGTSKFAVPILEKISESKLNISVVYTQPPKKSSRGMKVQKTPVQVKSELLGLRIRTPSSLKNNIQEYNFIKNKGIDVALDDRPESPGIKFKDAELIGIPYQIVIGPKSLAKDVIEFKNRRTNIKEEIPIDNLNKLFELINE